MYIAAIVGRKNSGKTTVIEELIRQLSHRYSIAVVKHVHHRKGLEVDRKGKDTWRFKEAGAKTVIGISPDQLYIYSEYVDIDPISIVNMLSRKIMEYDIVLIEGFLNVVKDIPEIDIVIVSKNLEEDKGLINDILEIRGDRNVYIYCKECGSDEMNKIRIFTDIDDLKNFINDRIHKSK